MTVLFFVSFKGWCLSHARPRRCFWPSAALLGLFSPLTGAQIVTDGTVGPPVSLSGPEMTIGAELGATRGSNLFHSFQRFDIPSGQRATFTGPDRIQNVIGRVTGGQTSRIDGSLRSTVGQADVYLINPAGVVVGPNAKVDVPAALHLSTADELRFSDGSRYSASDPAGSTLTLAAPESFGFLSPQPASLTIEGSQLEVKSGKMATLTGGDVSIAGMADRRATFKAPGGEIRIEAVGDEAAEVPVATPSPTPGRGRLAITQADLETSGDGGGRITIRAGEAILDGAHLVAENQGAVDATGGLDLRVAGALRLDDSWLFADTAARGSGGLVNLQAGELWIDAAVITSDSYRNDSVPTDDPIGAAGGVRVEVAGPAGLLNGAILGSRAVADGDAGDVTLRVDGLLEVLNGAFISSSTRAAGNAGTVSVQAGSVRLDSLGFDAWGTGIVSQAERDSIGDAGDVALTVDGLLEVLNGAFISSSTWAAGNAGAVSVQAESVRLDSLGFDAWVTGITSRANSDSTGDAGDVMLRVDGRLEVLNGAWISSSTFAAGNAGTVSVQAGSACLDSQGLATGITSQAEPDSTGDAGDVALTVDGFLEVLNGAQISSSTFAAGNAGAVSVQAGSARLDSQGFDAGGTGFYSMANPDSTGHAGDVTLTVDGRLEVLNGAWISSSTWAAGNAGTVSVQAESVRLDSLGFDTWVTGISSRANFDSTGDAGDVMLRVDGWLEVLNGAWISSSTFAAGNAGTVSVQAGSVRLDSQGFDAWGTGIVSQAERDSIGDAGDVALTVDGLLEVLNGAQISSSTWATGNAGTVTIHTASLNLGSTGHFGGDIASLAALGSTGQVGNIVIVADRADIRTDGFITISAFQMLDPDVLAGYSAHSIELNIGHLTLDGGTITTQSTGNVPAAAINIQAQDLRLTHGSRITTESQTADAGPITIGGGRLWLTDSLITTSVAGESGDGGNITLTPQALILDGGFIQANTAASGARGGNILIDTRALITSEERLEIGGASRQTFKTDSGRNIIQAAAEGGEQGTIAVTALDLDITAALAPLATPFEDPDALLFDTCRRVGGSQSSSLVERGWGGIPASPGAPATVSFDEQQRLDRLLSP